MCRPVFVCILPSALPLAERLAAGTGGQVDLRGRDFDEVGAYLRGLFLAGTPIIGLCSTGILIRCLAPVLTDKTTEPPVLAVAEDGSAVVPLLGGHHGANALARRLAGMLATRVAVTTTGEVMLGVALDEPPEGWRLENPSDAKAAMAALISGARARLSGRADWLRPLEDAPRIEVSDAPGNAPVVLAVDGGTTLVYRRQTFILGVGCARGCDPDELRALALQTLAENGRSQFEVAAVHSIDLKADEAAVHALAAHLGVPARFHTAARLEREVDRLTDPSDIVFAEVGCHGVAEGAALAGASGPLVIPKTKSANATCALAKIGDTPDAGRARGSLAIVGIGPGQPEWRTPEVSRLLAGADELVGYGLYLDLLGSAARAKTRRDFALGQEEARCRYALERAGEGKRVVLVCSGDGGIYAMGALVMELMDRPEAEGGVSAATKRVRIVHAPGISALQAASARGGALLGHDFCAISLSDLLTHRDAIMKRLRAAAEGDFVIALYNPVSTRRRTLLAEARRILLQYRPADTPVLVAANLGRSAERLLKRTLGDLDLDEVDMLTIVLIGASTSRVFKSGDLGAGVEGHWMFTPRGYACKIDGELA